MSSIRTGKFTIGLTTIGTGRRAGPVANESPIGVLHASIKSHSVPGVKPNKSPRPGSIKGDVKRKHFPPFPGRFFLTSSPLCDGKAWGRSGDRISRSIWVAWFRAASSRLQAVGWQLPTMVLSETRAAARHYCFVGLSEGAYGAP